LNIFGDQPSWSLKESVSKVFGRVGCLPCPSDCGVRKATNYRIEKSRAQRSTIARNGIFGNFLAQSIGGIHEEVSGDTFSLI
jgi:hypothetical protein